MIEAPHYTANGGKHKSGFPLPAELFDGQVHEAALHQAVKTYLGNQRQGTAKTKTRSFISGGNKKPWRQKGTGRARQGSIRSPLWRGGGTVFGPIPRDYRSGLPRKIRSLARRSAFNARAREGNLFVIDPVMLAEPKTRELAGLIDKMGLTDRKVLVLTNGLNRNLYLSGRNLPMAEVMSFSEASAFDVLWADALVVEQGALGGVGEVGEVSEVSEVRRTGGRKSPSAKKPAAKKPATKKPAAAKKGGATKGRAAEPSSRRAAPKKAKKPKKKE